MKALAADDPRVIGEYRLRALLGAGGMGRVYLGLSPAGRAVAIKVVNPELAGNAEFLRRFGQEVAAARAVSGIYTAPVVASGLDERPPWLATAFVPGPSLDQVVGENGPLPEQALWPLLAGLVEALQAIHGCGVVHRDLKPANVLLAADGPRVIDFGISRATDGTQLTAAGVVFGTPGYMSPEQAEGRGAGPASDVFALGCVATYAAVGAGPFGGGTAAAILYRVVHDEPALAGVPPQLREVIAACLAKDPARRPALRDLARTVSSRMDSTGLSAVAFWPASVARLIGAYQAQVEQQTRGGKPPEAGGGGFSWATHVHPRTTPSDPGRSRAPSRPPPPPSPWPSPAPQPQSPPPAPAPGPGTGWPHPRSSARQEAGSQAVPAMSPAFGSSAVPGSRGYPQPQGYLPSQGYPQPQGYGGVQTSQPPAPPRGYLPASGGPSPTPGYMPNGAASSYPQRYQPGSRGPIAPLPPSMTTAVQLMYAGAAYALVWAIGTIAVSASVIRNHPVINATFGQRLGVVVFLAVAVSVIDIALWLGIARACRLGRNGARVTGTVLFGLHSVAVLGIVADVRAGLGPVKALTAIGWLIGLGAVVALWHRSSSAFFCSARRRR